MIGLVLVVAVVLLASAWTLVELRNDRPREVPRSHRDAPD